MGSRGGSGRLASRLPRELEPCVRPPERGRTAAKDVAVTLEVVDEECERRAIAEREAVDVERDPRGAEKGRRARRAVDALAHADERRQRTGHPPDDPGAVELAHQPTLTVTVDPSRTSCSGSLRSSPSAQPRSASKSQLFSASRTGPVPERCFGPVYVGTTSSPWISAVAAGRKCTMTKARPCSLTGLPEPHSRSCDGCAYPMLTTCGRDLKSNRTVVPSTRTPVRYA